MNVKLPDLCTGCSACSAECKMGAIRLELNEDGFYHAVINSDMCIKCGRCINSCPMGLSPVDIHDAYYDHDADKLDKLMADLCVGCGTCSYVCPSKRQLTPTVTLAKTFLKKEQSKRES